MGGFRFWGLRVQGLGASGFRVSGGLGLGLRVWGLRVQGLGAQGLGFRV